jgi:hypothetical protein
MSNSFFDQDQSIGSILAVTLAHTHTRVTSLRFASLRFASLRFASLRFASLRGGAPTFATPEDEKILHNFVITTGS